MRGSAFMDDVLSGERCAICGIWFGLTGGVKLTHVANFSGAVSLEFVCPACCAVTCGEHEAKVDPHEIRAA